ncbi:MAG: type II secretion system F family protein [Dokdonella sp.]
MAAVLTAKHTSGMSLTERLERMLGRRQFGVRERTRFYQKLERFTKRGHPHEVALKGMWQRYERNRDPRRHMFLDVLSDLKEGKPFSDAIAPFIPAAERLMIKSGELVGEYPAGFSQAAKVADGVGRMLSALRTQLAYPVVLLLAGAAALLVAAYLVIPSMLQVAPDPSQWPLVSRVLYDMSWIVRHFGIVIALVIGAGTYVIMRTMPAWISPTRSWLDRRIPPWTMYRAYQGAAFLLAFGSLTQTGRPVSESLRDIAEVGSRWLASHLYRMIAMTNEGKSAGRAINTGLLDDDTVGGIEDYSASGSFDQAIVAMGEDAIEDGVITINAAGARARGLAFLVMMALILILWAGVSMLMLDIYTKAQMHSGP